MCSAFQFAGRRYCNFSSRSFTFHPNFNPIIVTPAATCVEQSLCRGLAAGRARQICSGRSRCFWFNVPSFETCSNSLPSSSWGAGSPCLWIIPRMEMPSALLLRIPQPSHYRPGLPAATERLLPSAERWAGGNKHLMVSPPSRPQTGRRSSGVFAGMIDKWQRGNSRGKRAGLV